MARDKTCMSCMHKKLQLIFDRKVQMFAILLLFSSQFSFTGGNSHVKLFLLMSWLKIIK